VLHILNREDLASLTSPLAQGLLQEDALAPLSHPLSGLRELYCHPIQRSFWHPAA